MPGLNPAGRIAKILEPYVVQEGARVGVLRVNADERARRGGGAGGQAGVGLEEVTLSQPVNAVTPLPVVQHQVEVSLPRRRIGRVRPGYQTPHQGLWRRPRDAAASSRLCFVFVRLFAWPLRHLGLPLPGLFHVRLCPCEQTMEISTICTVLKHERQHRSVHYTVLYRKLSRSEYERNALSTQTDFDSQTGPLRLEGTRLG
jgi:hypothetical protein